MSFFQKYSHVVLMVTLLSAQAQAANTSSANAERLLELTHAERLAIPVYIQVQQMFAKGFEEAHAPSSKQAVLESYQAKANTILDRAIGWEQLKPNLIKLYADEFTEEELKQMVNFYQSDIGRKMLAKLPELNHRSAQMAQVRLEEVAPEVNKLLDNMVAELGSKKK